MYFYNKTNCSFEYLRDSISNGEKIKVLKVDRLLMNCTTRSPKFAFVKQRNDSVWFYHAVLTNETWQLLINYNAQVNEKWNITIYPWDATRTYTMNVTSVSTETINGFPLKKLNVSYSSIKVIGTYTTTIGPYTTSIYERIGFLNCFFPFHFESDGCDLDYLQEFLCYQDSTFGVKQFSSLSCDYTYIVGLPENSSEYRQFELFPVPADNTLIVRSQASGSVWKRLLVYNGLGQLIRDEDVVYKNEDLVMNTDALQNGMYLLQLVGNGQQSKLQKFVVRH
jgi:hypothetical protein